MTDVTGRRQQLRDEFVRVRGYWNEELWGELLRLDPDFFEAYVRFSGAPWERGVLDPKVRELIYVAVDASTNKLYVPGIRQHMLQAVHYGATRDEILEVLELVSAIGIHTLTVGLPILLDVLPDDVVAGDSDDREVSA